MIQTATQVCSLEISAVEEDEDALSRFGSSHVTHPICAESTRVYDSNMQKCNQQRYSSKQRQTAPKKKSE
jgi:hypothetical protein